MNRVRIYCVPLPGTECVASDMCAPTAVLVGARCSGMEGMAFKPIGRFLD